MKGTISPTRKAKLKNALPNENLVERGRIELPTPELQPGALPAKLSFQ